MYEFQQFSTLSVVLEECNGVGYTTIVVRTLDNERLFRK